MTKQKKNLTLPWILALVLAAAVLLVLGASVLTGDPMPLGFGAASVLSGSMEPELSVGDLLLVVAVDDYRVGDVIVYRTGKTPVTHRIVSIGDSEVVTKGDANNTPDTPISREQILGKVVLAIPCAGYVVNVIKTPAGTLAVALLALWLLAGSFRGEKKETARQLKEEIERLKQETDS